MAYCTLRSSLTAQPPLTIPEIALRLGVHPAYYQNGIKVFALSRLPTDKELYPHGHIHINPAVGSTEPSGSDKSELNPPPYDDLNKGMNGLVAAWKSKDETLARVVPVNPPSIKEDGNHVWRFDGGSHANEEVFLPGHEIPQWDVDLHNIGLNQIALVPRGGALRIPGHDEPTDRGEEDRDGESNLIVVAAAGFSAVALASEESPAHHEPGHEPTANHEPWQESTVYHDPAQHGPEHYSHAGLDESHMENQDAVQMASEYLQSETQADETILGNMH